jgi:hypothetical protein
MSVACTRHSVNDEEPYQQDDLCSNCNSSRVQMRSETTLTSPSGTFHLASHNDNSFYTWWISPPGGIGSFCIRACTDGVDDMYVIPQDSSGQNYIILWDKMTGCPVSGAWDAAALQGFPIIWISLWADGQTTYPNPISFQWTAPGEPVCTVSSLSEPPPTPNPTPAPTAQPTPAPTPVACAAGSFSSGAGTQCTPCAAGTFSNETGASSMSACTACPAGQYSVDPGSTSCLSCTAGYYLTETGATSDATCTPCPAGTYSSSLLGSASCVACPAGTYSGMQAAIKT